MKMPHADTEPIRSFCAHVINLCYEVEGACTLTDFTVLRTLASRVRQESEVVQSIYGGHPARPKKSPIQKPTSNATPKQKKKR